MDWKSLVDSTAPLDSKQRGHLRHFFNLANAPDGVWDTMGAQLPGQEWLDSYRYQLAEMVYGAGLAHFHRLPAARGPFKELIGRLIGKMLRREVWDYWYLTSKSGVRVNPDIKELREGWADPVKDENIMYSGHLLAMLTIYSVLFNDDRYSEPGSLKFVFDPIFWGMGPETFEYDIDSLQHVILGQMERSGWLGCCCESNMRFIVCNQFPLVAFRLNDLRKGTRVAPEAQAKYSQAWAKKGWLDSQGYFIDWHRVQQDKLESRGSVGWSAWAATFMNAWNPAVSREVFPKQIAGWVRKGPANGTMSIASPNVAALRRAELAKGASEADLEIENEQELNTKVPWMMPLFGYIVAAISELGPREKLDGLLNYADTFFNPTWREGGLYYPMNPKSYDDKGNHVFVDPLSGNAMIAYARLNVEDGMRKFYDGAWKKGDERWNLPFLESVEPANKVDVTRARFFETEKALVVGIACWNAEQSSLKLEVKIGNATDGSVEVLENGEAAVGVEVKRREGCVVLEFDLSGTDGERVFILRV